MNDEKKPSPGRTFGWVLAFWASYAVLLIGSGMLSGMLPESARKLARSSQLSVFGVVTSLGAFALTVLLARREKISLDELGVALRRGSPLRFIIGFLIGLALVAINVAILSVTTGMRWQWAPEASSTLVLGALIGFFLGSCGEELGFRGYPLRKLDQIFGLWVAQAIVALAFALYHRWVGWPWMNAVIGTGMGSLLFGMAAIASRGLALPIGMHAASNFGEWSIGARGSPGFWKIVEGGPPLSSGTGMISYVSVMGLGILAFWFWYRSNAQGSVRTPPAQAVP